MVTTTDAGVRVDQYLSSRELPLSRSQIKRLIDLGYCLLNGQAARPARRVHERDQLSLTVPPPVPDEALPEDLPLEVLFEDEHLIVVDKAAGMVVHPSLGHRTGTLVNALLGYCTNLSGVGGALRPGIVHRLDMLTSGVLVASKSDQAHLGLAEQFAVHDVERVYLALVAEHLAIKSGTFDTMHGRHPTARKKFTSRCVRGKKAVTHYRVIKRLRGATLVEARLETGRTHQVRVHFNDAGHPVLGDPIYGKPPRDLVTRQQAKALGRQALHAHVLGFEHPVTGRDMRFCTPPPPDMQSLEAALTED